MLKVYTGGTFDLLHPGHVEFLSACANLGAVTVSLNTDEFIASYKGKLPACTYAERKYMLEALSCVARVVENTGGPDSKPAILAVNPQIVAIGSDWFRGGAGDYLKQMDFTWEWLHKQGIALTFIPRVTPISSTIMKGRIRDDRGFSSLP